MRRQRARQLARLSLMTGLPPSEIRRMTVLEIGAYVETLQEAHDA